MQHSTENDLDWLAFRYISGEMAGSEVEQFESLLAEDQTARDAVVRAVELSQTIFAAHAAPQTRSVGLLSATSQHWMQHLTWISTSVAALLLVTLALNFNRPSSSATADPNDLARAWIDHTDEPLASESTSVNSTLADSEEFVTAEPPAWMLEAVQSLHGDGSTESDDSGDEEMES